MILGTEKHDRFELRRLTVDDVSALVQMLADQRPEYLRGFFPFAFDAVTIADLVANANRDTYWAIRTDGQLAGFCMLRGLDSGFSRPSFGVVVAEKFSGHGLARKSLAHALRWCRDQDIGEVMLTVADDNVAARAIYEDAGFVRRGCSPDTGHAVYTKILEKD